jgi:hypothetical protein
MKTGQAVMREQGRVNAGAVDVAGLDEDDDEGRVLAALIQAAGMESVTMEGEGAQGEGKLDEAQAQTCLSRFGLVVHLLLEQYLSAHEAQVGGRVYDAGLATGFYGVSSAIAQGLMQPVERELGATGDEDGEHERRLMQEIWKAGQSHGQIVRDWARHAPATLTEASEAQGRHQAGRRVMQG